MSPTQRQLMDGLTPHMWGTVGNIWSPAPGYFSFWTRLVLKPTLNIAFPHVTQTQLFITEVVKLCPPPGGVVGPLGGGDELIVDCIRDIFILNEIWVQG
jgi:hypothetical protein